MIALFAALLLASPALSFAAMTDEHVPGAEEYRAIWTSEGEDIVRALEAASGLRFPEARLEAIVGDTSPMMGYDGRTMRLRARYSPAFKRATLVHELGHLLAMPYRTQAGLDDHRLLYLFLHDAWSELYGPAFADRMAAIERRIGPDYDEAWNWALTMSREERQARLRSLRGQLPYAPVIEQRPTPAG